MPNDTLNVLIPTDVKDKTYVPIERSKVQSEGQGIPYSELFKAYTDILRESNPAALEAFGKKSPLGQRMEIMDYINPDISDSTKFMESNAVARRALQNMHALDSLKSFRANAFPMAADYDLLRQRQEAGADTSAKDPNFDLYGSKGFKNIVGNTAAELNQSIADLKSMSKKDVDLQKLKEKSGMDFISDKDFYEGNKPFMQGLYAPLDLSKGELPAKEKYQNDINRDKNIYTIPENTISAEDSTAAMDKLKAKQEYANSYPHIGYELLKFTPLSPISVAKEQGEPLSRGLAGAGVSLAGTAGGALASPFITPYGGAAIAGASNALGDEIARGERPDEYTGAEIAKSYLIPTATGAALGAGMAGAGKLIANKTINNKKLKALDDALTTEENKASQVASDLSEASEAYKTLNTSKWKGEPYDYNRLSKTPEEKAAEESTNKVMAKIRAGKFNELDVDDIDNLILNPERAEEIAGALANQREAFANQEARLALLQKLNSDPTFIKHVRKVLGTEGVNPAFTEYGYDDLVRMARGEARQDLNNTTDLQNEIRSLLDPTKIERYDYVPSAQDIAASKLVYSDAKLPKTADQVIFDKFGYDQWGKAPVMGSYMPFDARRYWDAGKGLLIKDVNASMPNASDEVKSKIITPFVQQYMDNPTASGIAFGRGPQIQAQSYVAEAVEGINNGTLMGDPDKFMDIAKEYMKWRLPKKHTRADEDAILREFVANIKIALNKPGAGYTYKDPSSMTTAELANRGKDVLRAIRNPSTSELHSSDPYGRLSFEQLRTMYDPNRSPENFLGDIATMLDHNNIRLRNIRLRDGEIKGDPAFGWSGGFERPSKEAIGAFTGRKDMNKFRYTIEPKLKESLATNANPTLEEVRVAAKKVDDLTKANKVAQDYLKLFRQGNKEQQEAIRKLSPLQRRAMASLGVIPNVYAYSSNEGLSNSEEKTRQEEMSKDPGYVYGLIQPSNFPGVSSIFNIKPKAGTARSRGNVMPYRYLYIPTK